jgi:FMN reductase
MAERDIRIVLVKGSVRPGNYTSMAAALVLDELGKHKGVSVEVIDPGVLDLSPPGTEEGKPDPKRIREIVKAATGIVLATPEYHGSFSSTMKLVIENLGFPSVMSGKPVALLGVAAGTIGAIKSLESLGSVCQHIGAIVLPGPVSVANVRDVFDEDGNCLDAAVEKRVRSLAANLIRYIEDHICPRISLEAYVREKEMAEEGMRM